MWPFRQKNIQEWDDSALIEAYQKSKNTDFVGELYKRYSHLVVGVCLKYLKDRDSAKDATLEIFENLMEDLLKHSITNFKSWLHSVARNHCLMQLRKQSSKVKQMDHYREAVLTEESAGYIPYEETMQKEALLTDLEKGIQLLKEEQQICIKLFYIQKKTYQEITDLTDYTLNDVKSYIQNGKRNLKIYLTRKQ